MHIVYLSLSPSVMVDSKKVKIGDISTVFCQDPAVAHRIRNLQVFQFPTQEQNQKVITALAIAQTITKEIPDLDLRCLGNPEIIVYQRHLAPMSKLKGNIKTIALMLLTFLGTAFSIMSYNGDVGTIDLLERLYDFFTNAPKDQWFDFGVILYCFGLFVGLLVFFNHGINHKLTDDPTPLQVQMRLYEQDVNTTIVVDSERKNHSLDADS